MLCNCFLHLLLPVYCTARLLISILQSELALQNNYFRCVLRYISTKEPRTIFRPGFFYGSLTLMSEPELFDDAGYYARTYCTATFTDSET